MLRSPRRRRSSARAGGHPAGGHVPLVVAVDDSTPHRGQPHRRLACPLARTTRSSSVISGNCLPGRGRCGPGGAARGTARRPDAARLDFVEVLRGLPEWGPSYQAVRVFRDARDAPLPAGASAELGDRIVPTVYGLVNCTDATAERMVMAFLAGVAVAYGRQMSFLPDPVKVKTVSIEGDFLIAGIRHHLGPFGELNERNVRLLLAAEPPTWHGAGPDPDVEGWTWKLWFGSLRPFAVDTGPEYLAALEQFLGGPWQAAVAEGPVEPSALPRALDHLDAVWQVITGQALFKRAGIREGGVTCRGGDHCRRLRGAVQRSV